MPTRTTPTRTERRAQRTPPREPRTRADARVRSQARDAAIYRAAQSLARLLTGGQHERR
jgi:hypothetical protein